MKLTILAIFLSLNCFGQTVNGAVNKVPPTTNYIDSTDIKTISFKELNQYLTRINVVAMKQFNLTEQNKYNEILKELQAILQEADKKRK